MATDVKPNPTVTRLLNEHNRRRTSDRLRALAAGLDRATALQAYGEIIAELQGLGLDDQAAHRVAGAALYRYLAHAADLHNHGTALSIDEPADDTTINRLPADLYPAAGVIACALTTIARTRGAACPDAGVAQAYAAEILLNARTVTR